ncbi:hypothetical protein PFISCL1PPCAC_21705, partial [Pristionchus fissidentatus]
FDRMRVKRQTTCAKASANGGVARGVKKSKAADKKKLTAEEALDDTRESLHAMLEKLKETSRRLAEISQLLSAMLARQRLQLQQQQVMRPPPAPAA